MWQAGIVAGKELLPVALVVTGVAGIFVSVSGGRTDHSLWPDRATEEVVVRAEDTEICGFGAVLYRRQAIGPALLA